MAQPQNRFPRIARCSTFWAQTTSDAFRFETGTAEDVSWSTYKVHPNDIAIFKHGTTAAQNWNGHAALVVEPLPGGRFRSYEGNTTCPGSTKGGEANGGCVAEKVRQAGIRGFALQGFVRVRR
jgi:hypothetical protein